MAGGSDTLWHAASCARLRLNVLFNHLRNHHSAEYTALMLMLEEM